MKAIIHSDRSLSWRCVLLTAGVAAALLVPAMAQNAQSDSAKPAKAEKVKAETAKAAPGQTAAIGDPAIKCRTNTNSAFSAAAASSRQSTVGL